MAQLGPPAAGHLPRLLARVADPEGAAQGLERFLAAAPAAAETLRREPERLHPLLAIFSDSRFLGEGLIQDPTLADWLERARHEDRPRHPEEIAADLAALAGGARGPGRALALTRFKRREYLRIVLRDSLGLASLAETTWELSNLADAILAQAYAWAWNDCVTRFGTPMHAARQRRQVTGMAVLGLGKLGGGELNYSSDIDLLFVYAAPGETAQGEANREFFLKMAQRLTAYVSEPTPEGACYRVDLRLRPGGREGEIALPLAACLAYYQGPAREWERQMLIKARLCAGDAALGREFLAAVAPLVFPPAGGVAAAIAGAREARARIQAEQGRIGGGCDVKRDPGGIRDVEFMAQMLQRAHGGAEPWLQVGNTLQALQRLHDKGRLGGPAWQTLAGAYTLFRQIEHRLQLRFGEQTHRLPADAGALRALARGIARSQAGQRGGEPMPLSSTADAEAVAALHRRLQAAMAAVSAYWEDAGAAAGEGDAQAFRLRPPEPPGPSGPAPPAGLGPRGRRHWRHWVESAQRDPAGKEVLESLDAAARERLAAALDASDFLAEAMVLRPAEARLFSATDDWPDDRQTAWLPAPAPPPFAAARLTGAEAMRQLRREYQAAVWRQAAAELAQPRPVAAALRRMSQRAAFAVAAALASAQAELGGDAPPLGILALGRLGLGEFDLFSDADLVFIAASGDAAAARLATRVITLLASYTGDGMVFPVDARLRPEGTQGELTRTPAGLGAYFAQRASPWEAASYLKARPLAGDHGLNQAAMTALRGAISQRFNAAAVRAPLAAMRRRLEQETAGGGGFKSPPGGYYDADFLTAVSALSAPGTFPTGTLAQRLLALPLPASAGEQLAAAVTVLRAADHAIRLLTGKPPRDLTVPAVPALPRLLAGLLQRRLHPGGPSAEVAIASQSLRAIYHRIMDGA